jgi:hypothetical protein
MATVANKGEERVEQVVVGGAIALALVVGLGLIGQKAGMFDSLFGPPTALKMAAPVVEVLKTQAGGTIPRVLLSGVVATDDSLKALEKDVAKLLPGTELKNTVRVDQRAKDTKREIIRVSVAADALNEAWPRQRFGDVKRLELLWKDNKVTLRGAVYTPEAHTAIETSFNAIAEESRGAIQLRDVIRPAVPATELQTSLLSKLASRAATFNVDGTIKADDAVSAAVVADLAPLLNDLRGIEVLVSAGNADRGLAVKQAEALKVALVAAGADASGLRPVPAPQNNPLSFIVREKE